MMEVTKKETPDHNKEERSLKGTLLLSVFGVGGIITFMWIAVFSLYMSRV
ncbi:cytochrome c oxidase subunit 2A [Virgibacillus kekensis]|uniref:Cytochrome c oxidase subunit 2A n=1 Tax=Virgibacillus kekensis TaxID=202261 RepID=A0ABV9DK38_9BACI